MIRMSRMKYPRFNSIFLCLLLLFTMSLGLLTHLARANNTEAQWTESQANVKRVLPEESETSREKC